MLKVLFFFFFRVEMLVAPHRVAAGQRFGLGSGPVGQDVVLLVDYKSFTTVTISGLCSGIGCFNRFKVAPLFSVCAVLANVSSLTNNTSCEAASIIKKAGLLHM